MNNNEEIELENRTRSNSNQDDAGDILNDVDKSSLLLVNQNNNNGSPLLRQLLGTTGATVIALSCGMVLGYSAILLPQLAEASSEIKLSKDEESWIASLTPLQMALGCVLYGWAIEQWGRKLVNLLSAVLLTAGWVFVYFATSVVLLLVGRIVAGIAVGMACPSGACYVGEISEPKLRGIFLVAITIGVSTGILFVHLLGTYIAWANVALISGFMPLIAVVIFVLVSEPHVWYINKEKIPEARRAFHWYRGYSAEAKAELEAALRVDRNQSKSFKETWLDLRKPQFIKPFLIQSMFFVIMQMSGNNAVAFYSVTIMQSTVPSLDEYSATLIVDAIRLLSSGVACVLMKMFRMRPLTFFSGFGAAVSLFLLATSTYLSGEYPDNESISVITMILFVAYTSLINLGLVPIPWMICGEILPAETKGIGTGIASFINFLTIFAVVKTTPAMFDDLGVYWTYCVYGGFVLVGTTVLYFVLPETKDKTLEEIQANFVKKQEDILLE